ncbi:S-layer homology domain-containing protein [Paenibacillus sedimenti]|uniref:S-layer homology domain-containing protein n=1 Tax=Paenibacillus sedimenti TaxID=2770274 RepID=A0A926QLC4_9BACL|nr:S-layer homology domain-containing protein [Paenibacillus sedimenti]MBD0382437.1 S-layer homology domain-containing protein [Paenibacillus sedimenti]
MYIRRSLAKLVAIVSIATLMTLILNEDENVQAEAVAAQGKFNMSYMFFGSPSSYVSQVDKSGQTLDVVSPGYFHLNSDGSLQMDKISSSFINEMHKRGKKVVPFLSNDFDEQVGEKAIDNREAVVKQLVEAIKSNNLDGINMDIENVDATYRDKYTDMVKMLRNQLPSAKEVSVAVASNPTGTTKGWVAAYDYKGLAAVSDYLMLMAYDESYPGDTTPGPVASLPFVEKSIRYALTQVSPDKLVLGVPFYGRYWNQDPVSNGAGLSLQTVNKLIQTYKGTTRYDMASESPVATFTINPADTETKINGKKLALGTYTVWYENEQSLKAKLKLVGKYDLKGTGSWSLNQETADTWDYYSLWADGFYFADMQKHWAKGDVLAAANRGWMLGTASDRFAPDAALTRAEAATIMVRALGLSGEVASINAAGFKDVSAVHWARQDIMIAKQHGLIQGISDDRFAPDQVMTREQISALLSRVLKLQPSGLTAAKFSDVPAGSWSAKAIAAMSSNGLVDGFADGTFRPRASLTRAEMATLLSRVAPRLTK